MTNLIKQSDPESMQLVVLFKKGRKKREKRYDNNKKREREKRYDNNTVSI